MEVLPGLWTGSARAAEDPDKAVPISFKPTDMMGLLANDLYGGDLAGRSLLDCGCNAGGLSFAAAKLGAGRIFAFDARQHWLDQAAFLARHLDIPQVRLECLMLSDLPGLNLEPFDITMFAGLFYHLPDPVAGLKAAADLTRELIIVNTAVMPQPYDGLVLNSESPTQVLSGVDGLAWLPTGPRVLARVLSWCGFPHVRVDVDWNWGPPGWKRLQVIAARDETTFARYDQRRPDARLSRFVGPKVSPSRRVIRGVSRRLKSLRTRLS